ncbi:MAG: TetR/AcrR family transcriptional regulator [Pseudomonadota bacterium]
MSYARFKRAAGIALSDICQEMLADNRGSIKLKKDKTALKNLELIIAATLQMANRKGFQAMTMRDLAQASGLSMGTLYDCFAGKDELLEMLQNAHRQVVGRAMAQAVAGVADPAQKLAAAIRAHLYLSEAMQPWFFFSYMEARHLNEAEKEKAKQSELATEKAFADIVAEGRAAGAFADVDPELTAAVIKAAVQDWYLKRGKYARRRVSVERYADFVVAMMTGHCRGGGPAAREEIAS